MNECPFYNICKLTKNNGFCNDSSNLLLCKEHNRLKKEFRIRERADQILKEGVKIGL